MHKSLIGYIVILLLHFSFIQNGIADSKSTTGTIVDDHSKNIEIYKDTFTCAGIALIDHGMALDRDGDFIDVNSRKLICKFGMHAPICSDPSKNQTCTCPPPEWKANNCSEKYSEFQRIKYIEWKKLYDKIINQQKLN